MRTAADGCSMGIIAETGSNTVVVALEGPVDLSIAGRIQAALRPFARIRTVTVRLDLNKAQAPPEVSAELHRRFVAA